MGREKIHKARVHAWIREPQDLALIARVPQSH